MRKRINFDLMDETATRKINKQSKLTFGVKIGESLNFILYSFNTESTLFSKPIYAEVCILELSNLFKYLW